jgi:hypothetical protein
MEENKTTIRLSPDLHKKLKMFCLENDITFNDFCVESMIYYMKNKILPGEK